MFLDDDDPTIDADLTSCEHIRPACLRISISHFFQRQRTTADMAKTGNFRIKEYGAVTQVDRQWPSGDFLMRALGEEKEVNPEQMGDPAYWQASARWALLRKYGYDDDEIPTEDQAYQTAQGSRRLVFTDDQIEAIQNKWDSLVTTVQSESEPASSDNDNDLLGFIRHSRSKNRVLQWDIMFFGAGTQFNMHAHPNLELVYCAQGALHQIRMEGEPWDQGYEPRPDDPSKLKGPNLTQLNRPWHFGSLRQGEWLVNEAGSIHKSFTATSGDGCLLLTLWSRLHANVVTEEEPEKVNIQKALDTMDDRLGQCDCTKWDTISETFLPESEKDIRVGRFKSD
jgi:hypothetical protein